MGSPGDGVITGEREVLDLEWADFCWERWKFLKRSAGLALSGTRVEEHKRGRVILMRSTTFGPLHFERSGASDCGVQAMDRCVKCTDRRRAGQCHGCVTPDLSTPGTFSWCTYIDLAGSLSSNDDSAGAFIVPGV